MIIDIKKRLSDAGLKATHPRIVVYKELIISDQHPTAEAIYENIKTDNPSISLGSVYRILDVLNMGPHGHIYCLKSDTLQDFYDEELYGLINDFFRKKKLKNFRINEIKLRLNGEKVDPDSDVEMI